MDETQEQSFFSLKNVVYFCEIPFLQMHSKTKNHSRVPVLALAIVTLLLFGACSRNQKVTFCHHPPGNPNNPQTLTVSVRALSSIANEALDYQGECRAPTGTNNPPPPVIADKEECKKAGLCGEFNYTYGVSDNEDGHVGQFYEISTNFENSVNESQKESDAGNDIRRFETGVAVDSVNTDYIDSDGLPSGKNVYNGEIKNAVIFGE